MVNNKLKRRFYRVIKLIPSIEVEEVLCTSDDEDAINYPLDSEWNDPSGEWVNLADWTSTTIEDDYETCSSSVKDDLSKVLPLIMRETIYYDADTAETKMEAYLAYHNEKIRTKLSVLRAKLAYYENLLVEI